MTAYVAARVEAAILCLLIAFGWTWGPAWAWALCAVLEVFLAWKFARP